MSDKYQVGDYVVFTKTGGEKYLKIFKDFMDYNLDVIKVFRSIDDTKVVLINTEYGKYILKVFAPKQKKNGAFSQVYFQGRLL